MQIKFETRLEKFGSFADKTGWTYLVVPANLAIQIHSSSKKAFKVKGSLDQFPITQISLLPFGQGNYMLPFNQSMRKGTGKKAGDHILVCLKKDLSPFLPDHELLECLDLDQEAKDFFFTLNSSNQKYFSKWVSDAKTPETKAKRISRILEALSFKLDFPGMLRRMKQLKG